MCTNVNLEAVNSAAVCPAMSRVIHRRSKTTSTTQEAAQTATNNARNNVNAGQHLPTEKSRPIYMAEASKTTKRSGGWLVAWGLCEGMLVRSSAVWLLPFTFL